MTVHMMAVLRCAFGGFLAMLTFMKCIYGENIVRHDCDIQATFYKVASNYAMTDTANITNTTNDGYMGCVDLCIEYPLCKAFNYKAVNITDAICELLHKDRTTNANDIVSRNGWSYYDTGLFSSQIGQFCRSLTYNPCYPCLCIDSCYSSAGYTCNCTTGSPGIPDIYMSFEKTVEGDATKTPFNRGKDMNGISHVAMMNGANIGTSTGRPGKVLRMNGTNAGADAGVFNDHQLNNPAAEKFSISLWLRVVSPQSPEQRVFGTGSKSWDTGVDFTVADFAKTLRARMIVSNKNLYSGKVTVYDTLTTWSHIVITSNEPGPMLELYVNGRKVASDSSFLSRTASQTNYPNLIFGGGIETDNIYWGMHIDDFAFWKDRILTSNEIIYVMNKGFVQDGE